MSTIFKDVMVTVPPVGELQHRYKFVWLTWFHVLQLIARNVRVVSTKFDLLIYLFISF